jgi:hypothetical protein
LLLATYIHEQLHWWASRSDLTEIEREWRRRYPEVPVGFPEGRTYAVEPMDGERVE